jgi:hypothetical protein
LRVPAAGGRAFAHRGIARFMAYYRLYFLNQDGRIMRVNEVEVADDGAAVAAAVALDHAYGIAIWQEARYVGELDTASGQLLKPSAETLRRKSDPPVFP